MSIAHIKFICKEFVMKKGINIWSFPGGTIKESLELAKKAGFEGVELALNGTGELSME